MEPLQMSESEKEIMEIIWHNDGKLFIAELLEKVEALNKGWKRATVRTFLARLIEKGFLRSERCGKKCAYAAVFTREEYLQGQAHAFVDEVFGGSVQGLLATLFGRDALEPGELSQLERFWNEGKAGMK